VPKNSDLYWWFCVPNLQQTIWKYLDLPVKCPTFLSDFNQIWSSSTNFRRSPEYHIWRKFIQGQQRWCMRTGWRTRQSLALFATIRTRLKGAWVSKVTLRKQARPSKWRRLATPVVHKVKGLMWLRSWTNDLTQSGVDGRGGDKRKKKPKVHGTWIATPGYMWS